MAGTVIKAIGTNTAWVLVRRIAVMVVVFTGGTVVMAAGSIGASGVSESHRAAQEQRQERCKQSFQGVAPPLQGQYNTARGRVQEIGQSRLGIGSEHQEGSDAYMAKRERPPITVKAYVMVNGVETDVDTLDDERRRQLATAINTTVLNTFFAGKARFYPAEEPENT